MWNWNNNRKTIYLYAEKYKDGKTVTFYNAEIINWKICGIGWSDFYYKFAENIVMDLIVDDGHQRSNLFNPEFIYSSVGYDSHKTFKICSVCNYAKALHAIGYWEEPPDVINSVQYYIQRIIFWVRVLLALLI